MPTEDSPPRRGPTHARWKGGTTRRQGRVYVWTPDHPRADQHRYVPRATLVAEQSLGRPLVPGEVVHHRNRVKDDDRPENLAVMTTAEHSRLHAAEDAAAHRGEQHPNALLTDAQVLEIRARYAAGGVSLRGLAQEYGCNFRTIWVVVRHKAWRHLR